VRRIRFVFLLLASVLLVPVVLLVRSALLYAEHDERAQLRTVAERAGDELERELSRIVKEEEARPFGHYRFYYVPPDVAGGRYGLSRSPLAGSPAAPYVIGHFEIQPDGSIGSPMLPREVERARERGDWRPEDAAPAERRLAAVRRIVESNLEAQVPGTARVTTAPGESGSEAFVGAPPPGQTAPLAEAEPAEAARPTPEAYRALLALNRSADARGQVNPLQLQLKISRLEDGSGLRVTALGQDSLEPLAESALRFVAPSRQETWFAPESLLRDEVPVGRRVDVYPMSGQLAGPEHLILLRAAMSQGRWYWQGAVLSVPALSTWLDASVFGESDLLQRDYLVRDGPQPPPLTGAVVPFGHRFARPFDSLAVRIGVPAMTTQSSTYVKLLALLVLFAGSAGLYALYRMVEVTVGFAERRSNFAAAVTHELKTPLTAIRMYAEMLRDGMVDSEAKRQAYAETITTESERLSRLIDNVLEFSRLEQGSRDLRLEAGPLGPVVTEAARILEGHARRAGFELRLEIEEGLPPVRYDRDALVQVVFNLVDNALKYARDASERSVVLRCRRAQEGVELSVRDRGPGVPADQLSRIFEAFYRGGDELTRTTKGTGIGLALVRGLAQRMGAAVSGRNAPDGGFEVALSFPASA